MNPVLFLGYDGCLHPNAVSHSGHEPLLYGKSRLFEHASDLVELLAPYPEVDIVLSTEWVWHYGVAMALSYLPEPLRKRVVGTTAEFKGDPVLVSKFDQILYYVTRRRVDFWLALHHDDGAWPAPFRTQLVWPDPHLGIGKQTIQDDLKDKLLLLNARSRRWRSQAFIEPLCCQPICCVRSN
ncbi:HAD domain-containing protein [Ralstonia mannitolilytica]|uniref:Uncharacterized protein n=1 Tax=Ralstonia mannitolilytica TaxID=105219 RepID=A0AAD2B315_9RALS|nr:HAD domain-containing protein [Ralstonia mannitolilytica]MBY4721474.1 hypothetical protein [Ralstonia mannitolilytica]CAJ0698309.1 hypothetical protein R77591_04962 [Ralstonia mannitolilytica]